MHLLDSLLPFTLPQALSFVGVHFIVSARDRGVDVVLRCRWNEGRAGHVRLRLLVNREFTVWCCHLNSRPPHHRLVRKDVDGLLYIAVLVRVSRADAKRAEERGEAGRLRWLGLLWRVAKLADGRRAGALVRCCSCGWIAMALSTLALRPGGRRSVLHGEGELEVPVVLASLHVVLDEFRELVEFQALLLGFGVQPLGLLEEVPAKLFGRQARLIENGGNNQKAEQLLFLLRVRHLDLVADLFIEAESQLVPSSGHLDRRREHFAFRLVDNLLERIADVLEHFLLSLLLWALIIRLLVRVLGSLLLEVDVGQSQRGSLQPLIP